MSKTVNCNILKFYQDDEDEQKYPDCYQLIADFDKREISTNCGDYYYDLSFNFDDFINFAKHVEKLDKTFNNRKESKMNEVQEISNYINERINYWQVIHKDGGAW